MEFTNLLQSLKTQYQQKLPFVVFRLPDKHTHNAYLQKDDTLHKLTDFKSKGFVFSPFDAHEDTLIFPITASVRLEAEAEKNVAAEKLIKATQPIVFDEEEKKFHKELVKKAIAYMKEGTSEKIVLARVQEVKSEKSVFEIYQNLTERYPTAFVYCWYHPQVGLWMGATPETLIHTQRTSFKTMALAGTQVYSATNHYYWGDKEKEEQAIVTRSILNDLKQTENVTSVMTSATYTHRAGNVVHLKTDIEGFYNGKAETLQNVVEKLHPTPAVCGLPKTVAKQFILKNEKKSRKFYAGYLGELNKEREISRNIKSVEQQAYRANRFSTDFYVNLRCMECFPSEQKYNLYVGGGITTASNPEAEWTETLNKAKTLASVM